MTPDMPERAVTTVLFTDIVGSTELVAELGDRASREVIDRHNRIVRDHLSRWAGKEVWAAGDGFMATFDVPANAIRCAVGIATELPQQLGLELRAGLHTGECEVTDEGPRGIAVHIASRVAGVAGPGEVFISSTVKDLVDGSGLRFSSRGAYTLKGVRKKWRLYRVDTLVAESPSKPKQSQRQTSIQGTRARRSTQAGSQAISVVIVDDHPMWRDTLERILKIRRTARIVAQASNGNEAVEVTRSARPDVVVMDIDLPGTDGLEATKTIHRECPDSKILMLSASSETSKIVNAVRAGATGYLVKSAKPAEVLDAVRRVHVGELVFPPEVAAAVIDQLRSPGNAADDGAIRVMVCDSSIVDLEGLAGVLRESGFDVVGRVARLSDLVERLAELRPDVVVIAFGPTRTDEPDEVQTIRRIRKDSPGLGVLALSHDVDVARAAALLGEGTKACGWLLKSRVGHLDELRDAIRRVSYGEAVVDPDVVTHLVRDHDRRAPLGELSEREREVLHLMAEGRSNQAISERLHMAPKTVEGHVASIFMKLGLEPAADDHRRVLAVVAYLRSS